MKILITQELFPPDVTGGGENLSLEMAHGLMDRGHVVKVLCTGNPKIKKYEGIETVRVPINRYLMNLSTPIILKHAKDFDLIHTSSGNMSYPSLIAAKLLNKPICCYIHHILGPVWKDVRGNILGSVFQDIEKFILTKDYDAIIFQNKLSQKIGLGMGINRKKIFSIQPGIDYKKFQSGKVKKENFVLFVGNFAMNKQMVKVKGLEYLIESARRLPDMRFVIVGKGDYLNVIKRDSPFNVDFVGPLFGKDLIKIYKKASVFCLPSLTEGFGLALLEAMASGCAIVSTVDVEQEGLLIKPKNVENIVNGIKYYTSNPKRTRLIGNRNKKLVKKYTWKLFIEKLTKIYDLIIEERRFK